MNQIQDDNPHIIVCAGLLAFLLGALAIMLAEAHQLHRLLTELKWIAEIVG